MYHTYLTDIMEVLGYPIDRGGLCFGIMSMARQAILAGDVKAFDARIKRIEALCTLERSTTLAERFHLLERKEKMDLYAFFDGVTLYHKLFVPSEVLSKQYDQFTRDAAQFVTPTELADDPPILVTSDCFVFKTHEAHFKRWLDSLKKKLQSDWSIELFSSHHAIVISYDQREKHWILIDSNSLPAQRLAETQGLAESICEAFDCFRVPENLLFNATLFTKKSYSAFIIDQLSETEWNLMKEQSLQDARETDVFGANLLYLAATVGNLQLAQNIIALFVNDLIHSGDGDIVNQKTKYCATPLLTAAKHGHLAIVKHLIQHGAFVNQAMINGCTPLLLAAKYGHLAIVESLIEHEACVNQAMNDGCTPLLIAAQEGHLEVVDCLIQHGADLNLARQDGATPILMAKQENHLDIVEYLTREEASRGFRAGRREPGGALMYINYHANIIDLMEALDYPINKQGLCFGIVSMARQAILARSLKTFNARIRTIGALCELDQGITLAEKLKILNQQQNAALADLNVFFDGIARCYKRASPFGGHLCPDTEAALRVIPPELEQDPPVVVASDCFVFKCYEDQLKGWLDSLKERFRAEFAIELSSTTHGIVISYHSPQKKWILIDPTFLPTRALPQTQQLTEKIHQAFDLFRDSENIIFEAKLFTKQSHCKEIAAQLSQTDWDRMKQESIQQAKEKNVHGANLLHLAVNVGDVQLVKELTNLDASAIVNEKTDEGATALVMAAKNGDFEIVEHLVQKNARVDESMNHGCTPLLLAAQNGHVTVVEYLIQKGACVDSVMNDGRTSLLMAVQMGHLEIVKHLIEQGADPNLANNDETTPLLMAVLAGHPEVAAYLLEHGADAYLATSDGTTPLFLAAQDGALKMVECFTQKKLEVNLARKDSVTPLLAAVRNGYLDVVQHLIQNGAMVNLSTDGGCSPLLIAVQEGYLEIVAYLIEQKADMNAATQDHGMTPLLMALQRGYLAIATHLIEKGADVNLERRDGMTPLLMAEEHGYLEVVECLIEHGAAKRIGPRY